MTTLVVVRKRGTLAIAADSLVTFGGMRLAPGCEANPKLFRSGNSWIGMAGHLRWQPWLPPMTRANRRVNLRKRGFAPIASSANTPVGRSVPTPSP